MSFALKLPPCLPLPCRACPSLAVPCLPLTSLAFSSLAFPCLPFSCFATLQFHARFADL
jgi:hypothetical protein